MLVALITVHLVMGIGAPALVRLLGRNAFWVVAVAPALAFGWLLLIAPDVLAGRPYLESAPWIPALSVGLDFNLGLLQWLLALVVTGVGALVLFYCRWYFPQPKSRTLGLLVAFAGAMLGLVSADGLILLYVFWELTTVFSYLLIGHDSTRRANRAAATTALVVTTTGGLAMLVGIITFGVLTGSYKLSDVLAAHPTGLAASLAALLMLAGAISKSAMAPFHFWLPGAMAAPTPVSAYLHAAAMVKAGVYLVAALAPVFAAVPFWRGSLALLGSLTMILGGWRALRQTDLKLLLAYGTVSQLGFITMLVGLGTKAAAQAGIAMLLAHALFKAALFLTVGVVDTATGTRDLTKLTGLGRRLPGLTVAAGLAAASMAGVPPLFGFVAKESALDALVRVAEGGDGTGFLPAPGTLLIGAIVAGSTLTAAYSLRFWWGAFATKRDAPALELKAHPSAGFLFAPALLGVLCLALGFTGGTVTEILSGYVASVQTGAKAYPLALWHGFTLPLALSAIALTLGAGLFWQRDAVARVQATFPVLRSADEFYRATMRGLDWLAVEVTARHQRGSLAANVGAILAVFVLLVGGSAFVLANPRLNIVWYDNLGQVAVGAIMCVAAVSLMFMRGRVRAILTLGVTGYGTALLFLLHGGPDLALTQVLVETATLLVFLLVLRTLPKFFTERPLHSTRWWRGILALLVGATVTGTALLTTSARVAPPVSDGLDAAAKSFGYGANIVNVILVDTRAWDTVGEISVLVIAATGVASLIFLRSRVQARVAPAGRPGAIPPDGSWLRGSVTLNPASRSLIFEVLTRLLFGVMLVASVYLLLTGHNWPGGGFAGGLVAGLALVVRYLAAGPKELQAAAPFDAGRVLGLGLVVSVGSAITPALFGGRIFQSYHLYVNVPALQSLPTPWGAVNLFGSLHLVSSTVFDVGVYLVVVGMLLDLVRSLGSGIDAQAVEHRTPLPRPESTRAVPASERPAR